MRIERRYSVESVSPYEGVAFRAFRREATDQPSGHSAVQTIEVPARWSPAACEILDTRCLLHDGVPGRLRPVPERDVPQWLWRHESGDQALAGLAPGRQSRGETSAREVFDRLAGGWTYHGWKAGYFDSEGDAKAFFDEVRALLCRQMAAPEIAVWRALGLWWAYGIATGAPGGCVIDHRTGGLTAAGAAHLPPCGAFINGAPSEIAGGGVFDLWRREAALLADGLGSGTNLSSLGADGGTSLIDVLRVGDQATALFRDAERIGPPARTVVVDVEHPEAFAFAAWKGTEAQNAAALYTGSAIIQRHVAAIVAACLRNGLRPQIDPARNPALRLAIVAARQAMVPDATIERTIAMLHQGQACRAEQIVEPLSPHGAFAAVSGQNGWHLLRIGDAALEAEAEGGVDDVTDCPALDAVAAAAWSSGATGMLFSSAAEAWNTCAASGEIRAAAGDGDFLFLDDTACGRAVLNLAAFLGPQGFDHSGFAHAARLMTIALDIAVTMVALPTPRLARRSWEFRALGLGISNLGGALMSQAIPYDSDAGRAFCAATTALMTGTAYATSAEMAAEMGAFPNFAVNRATMLQVLGDQRRAADGAACGNAVPGWQPVALRVGDCRQTALVDEARAAWDAALKRGAEAGFRNAQVSLIAPADVESALLDCATRGIAPAQALVHYERLPRAGFRKTVIGAVTEGLARLGYGETVRGAITSHVAGRHSLAGAPGVNHEHLLRRGFTEAAIGLVEAALEGAPDIRFAFDRWTLGDAFCTGMLGFAADALDDPAFDMLSALGFSDAAIEAANAWCCGADTLEGAPYIDPAHLAVFDCVRSLGDRGRRQLSVESQIRMMAVAQPFVSGGIGLALMLPAAATVKDVREALLLSWRLGLKAVAVDREQTGIGESFADVLHPAIGAAMGAGDQLSVIEGGRSPSPAAGTTRRTQDRRNGGDAAEARMSEALAIARAVKTFSQTSAAGTGDSSSETIGTVVGEGTDASADAQTSRRRSSHVARSTASVPSSTDAAVEQRQV